MVAKLGASNVLHESDVEATNWMSALRAAREAMSERASIPPGASCNLDSAGVATVLDPASRRKFVLSPLATVPDGDSAAGPGAAALAQPVAAASPVEPAPATAPEPVKKKRFETVAMIPPDQRPVAAAVPVSGPTRSGGAGHSNDMQAPHPATANASSQSDTDQASAAEQAAAPPPEAAPALDSELRKKKKRFDTVGFGDAFAPSPRAQPRAASQAPRAGSEAPRPSKAPTDLELLVERDEEPTPENPLCYRERAYLLPRSTTVPEAEATLRWKLAELQRNLEARARGKFVNLAVFDHRWQEAPERPPVIVLQWRDWRSEVSVDYPAAARVSSLPPPSRPHEDHLADVFEALEELPRLQSAAEGLDFTVRLLERTIPSEAISACLYDINTDELRFVALSGTAASSMQGQAVPRGAGLFGQAARAENQTSVFADVRVEPAFSPEVDSRPGLEAHNLLLRPITHEHQLMGMLQLINRSESGAFSAEDINSINYIAERLGDFLHAARMRRRPLA